MQLRSVKSNFSPSDKLSSVILKMLEELSSVNIITLAGLLNNYSSLNDHKVSVIKSGSL